ncbi:MAG: hypothetical protein XXXJIFNMEKO3_00738 [Candidatus Erwinia impunctatus]|nr:hypothetical protein XXXJIFNMEKO_00738 [Culicoides impunctatus]
MYSEYGEQWQAAEMNVNGERKSRDTDIGKLRACGLLSITTLVVTWSLATAWGRSIQASDVSGFE